MKTFGYMAALRKALCRTESGERLKDRQTTSMYETQLVRKHTLSTTMLV